MADSEYEELRAQLAELGEELQAHSANIAKRTELVERARDVGMTWREAAGLLGMTEHGLIKAQKNAHRPGSTTTSRRRKTA